MQIDQRRHAHLRQADLHAVANDRVQHPRRQGHELARRKFNMYDLSTSTSLAILPTKPAPKQRVPAIVNFDFLCDMGRMNVRSSSDDATGPSPAPTAAPKMQLPS